MDGQVIGEASKKGYR